MTDPSRELDLLLNVNPSPAFVARVRERIASEPAPASRLAGVGKWLVPALAVAAALAAFAVVRQRSKMDDPRPTIKMGSDVTLMAPPTAAESAAANASVATPARPSRARASSSSAVVSPSSGPARESVAASMPVVLMAPDEAAMLRRLVTRFAIRDSGDAPVAAPVFTGSIELDEVRIATLTDLPPIVIDVLPATREQGVQ